jgi:hypothetical protein
MDHTGGVRRIVGRVFWQYVPERGDADEVIEGAGRSTA